jgi:hypothetical protein
VNENNEKKSGQRGRRLKATAPKYEEHAEIKINIKGISPVHLHKTRLIYYNEISADYSWRL